MPVPAMPLYVHEDLRASGDHAFLFINPDTGEARFCSSVNELKNSPKGLQFPVSDRLNTLALSESLGGIKTLISARLRSAGGSLDCEEFRKSVQALLGKYDIPSNHAESINGESALSLVDLEGIWKPGMSADDFCLYVQTVAAQKGMHVDIEDLEQPIVERLDEMRTKNPSALTEEQMQFLEDYGPKYDRSPRPENQ